MVRSTFKPIIFIYEIEVTVGTQREMQMQNELISIGESFYLAKVS